MPNKIFCYCLLVDDTWPKMPASDRRFNSIQIRSEQNPMPPRPTERVTNPFAVQTSGTAAFTLLYFLLVPVPIFNILLIMV